MILAKTKDRLLHYLQYKGLDRGSFYKQTGITRGLLDSDKLKASVKDTDLAKILATYKDLNIEWLLTGKGDKIKQEEKQKVREINTIYNPKTAEKQIDNQIVYLYDIEATAGLKSLLENKNQNIIDTIRIPNLPKCDGAVHVVGDSMYPILKSGDIVLYKEVHDIKCGIFWGEMYLLSVAVDDEEYITVKYLQKSDINDTFVKLVSHNPHHNPKDIPISSIRALALIKASIRLNTIV